MKSYAKNGLGLHISLHHTQPCCHGLGNRIHLPLHLLLKDSQGVQVWRTMSRGDRVVLDPAALATLTPTLACPATSLPFVFFIGKPWIQPGEWRPGCCRLISLMENEAESKCDYGEDMREMARRYQLEQPPRQMCSLPLCSVLQDIMRSLVLGVSLIFLALFSPPGLDGHQLGSQGYRNVLRLIAFPDRLYAISKKTNKKNNSMAGS